MTDTRLPEQWLGDITLDCLSDGAFRVHVNGLMWSVKYRQDGLVAQQALRYLHVDGARLDLVEELIKVRLWETHGDAGWQIVGFLEHQTSAADLAEQREQARLRQQRWRDKQIAEKPRDAASAPVTRHATGDMTGEQSRHVGQARAGKGREGVVGGTHRAEPATPAHRRPAVSTAAWPEVPLCVACGSPIDAKLWDRGVHSHPNCVP